MLSAKLLPILGRRSTNMAVWLIQAGQHCSLSKRLGGQTRTFPPRLGESCDALSLGEFANARERCERKLSTALRLGAENPRDEQRDYASTRRVNLSIGRNAATRARLEIE